MSSSSTASSRRCPACDAPNSTLSLFCAECGESMNAPESDATAAFRPIVNDRVEDDAQRTTAFQPEPYSRDARDARDARADRDDRDIVDSTRVSAEAPASPYDSAWQPTSAAPAAPPIAPVWSPIDGAYAAQAPEPAPLGMRGFVLGMVAVLLMLTVFLLWTWASLLDAGTRESIQDLFGFIG